MKKTINQGAMRSNNKRLILNFIHQNTSVAKRQIAQQLQISITSVSTFINELLTENLIMHSGNAASTGGRKSELFQFNPAAFYVIGADIQLDCLVVLLLNAGGTILTKHVASLSKSDEWHVAALLSNLISELCAQNHLHPDQLAGIGIGIPGMIDRASGRIEFAPNLGWKNVTLPPLLNMSAPVVLENEANAAALGEISFGAAKHIGNVIYLSLGSGIGAGLVVNHQLFEGKNCLAGEFGHMTIESAGKTCRCGNRGCWETYASNEAALRYHHQIADGPNISYSQLLTRFRQNEPVARQVIEAQISYLGVGMANLINGLNPEMFVIGGELAQIGEQIYPQLLKAIKSRAFELSFKEVRICFSKLENHAAALGAGSLAIQQKLTSF